MTGTGAWPEDPEERLTRLVHDLRTPLTIVQGFAELLERGGATVPDARRAEHREPARRHHARPAVHDDDLRVCAGERAADAQPGCAQRGDAHERARRATAVAPGRAVGEQGDGRGEQRRPEHHGRAGPGLGQKFVLLRSEHSGAPGPRRGQPASRSLAASSGSHS